MSEEPRRHLRAGDRIRLRGAPSGEVIGRVVLEQRVSTGHPGGFELWNVRGDVAAYVHPRDVLPAIYR